MISEFTCDLCGNNYVGTFKFTREGTIECYDCDNPDYYKNTGIIEVSEDDYTHNHKIYLEVFSKLLLDDVKILYKNNPNVTEIFEKDFFLPNGSLIKEKLFFQNNPIAIILEGHKLAHLCTKYLEGSHKKNTKENKVAENIVKSYLNLRYEKLNSQQIEELKELFNSNEALEIQTTGD